MRELLNLLNRKNELLTDLLSFVKSKHFYGEESEVDDIVAFVGEKQVYIDKLNEIEKKIKAYPKSSGDYKDVKAIVKKNNDLINSIAVIDKENISVMTYLRDVFKQNIKGSKIQQKYNVSYSNYAMDIRGSVFDSKQ